MDDRKPCPFCGSVTVVDGRYACCSNINCPCYDGGIRRIEWNRRPIDDALTAEVERLKAVLATIGHPDCDNCSLADDSDNRTICMFNHEFADEQECPIEKMLKGDN